MTTFPIQNLSNPAKLLEAFYSLSAELDENNIFGKLLQISMDIAQAERGVLLREKNSEWMIAIQTKIPNPCYHQNTNIDQNSTTIPKIVVDFVSRNRKVLISNNPIQDDRLANDSHIATNLPNSLACLPLIIEDIIVAILYLENQSTANLFSSEITKNLDALSTQAANCLKNARLYKNAIQNEQRQRNILLQSPEAIIITTPQGKIIEASQRMLDLFGYKDEFEIKQINARDLYADSSTWTHLSRIFEQRDAFENFETRCRLKNGETFECHFTGKISYDDSGHLVAWQGVFRNITFQQKLALKEKLKQTQILRLRKLETIGTFANNITHEFNNIFSAISGYTKIILRDLSEDNKHRTYLFKILQIMDRSRILLDSIQALSHRSSIEHEIVRIGPLLDECLGLLRTSLPENIQLRWQVHFKEIAVNANQAKLQQIIIALCTHAILRMANGGVLSFDSDVVQIQDDEQSTDIFSLSPGRYLRISISDTGEAMDEAALEDIFDPSLTVKQNYDTTFPLALVYSTLISYDGELNVSSHPDEGTTFEIYLPEASTPSKPIDNTDLLKETGNNERILFIDSELPSLNLMDNLLTDMGYCPSVWKDSSEALKIFRENPENWDLVITAQTMPGLNGLSVLREIHRIRPRIPAILIVGLIETPSIEESAVDGIQKILRKPIDRKELGEAITQALNTSNHIATSAISSPSAEQQQDSSTGQRLLVVEDDKYNAELLAYYLRENSYRVNFASNGLEALHKIKTQTFDLILLDVMMPELSGTDVLSEIRKRYSMHELPIIVVTAKGASEDAVMAFGLGANDYVTKPIDRQVLLARVATQLTLKHLFESNREFLGIASHDLKKPLMVIMDILETLLEDYPIGATVTDDLHELINMTMKSCDYMQQIVRDYLDLCAIESGSIKLSLKIVNLNTLARQAVRNNDGYALHKNHRLCLDLDSDLPEIYADEARISQVMDNLVGNAIKFSPLDSTTLIRTRHDGAAVVFEVQDSGPGLKQEDLKELFVGKFVQLSNRPTGGEKSTGLGLPICKQLIDLHGGEIGARNNKTSPGATFWFRLPMQKIKNSD